MKEGQNFHFMTLTLKFMNCQNYTANTKTFLILEFGVLLDFIIIIIFSLKLYCNYYIVI